MWPSALALAATSTVDGLDEPSDSGGRAVLTIVMPPAMASRQQSGPSPVVQWVWNSTGVAPAFASMIGTSALVRSGVSSPPGSLKQSRQAPSEAASRQRSA